MGGIPDDEDTRGGAGVLGGHGGILRTTTSVGAKLSPVSSADSLLRQLPSVDSLAASLDAGHLTSEERVSVAREAIDTTRALLVGGGQGDAMTLAMDIARSFALRLPTRVINATGVILHTNLGRAPLSDRARDAMARISSGYSNAELDRVDGDRGTRGWHTARLLRQLTGADDALVVNNNAAAVLLTLSALAKDRSVPVSRGELIEIGGSYRLPEIMRASGARLVEVGSTNRTRSGDYVTALQVHDCGLVLKVHAANYEIKGFVSDVGVGQLAAISDVPVAYDIGSGLLDATTPWLEGTPGWLGDEPGARQALEAGADLVLFSGDKMLGGPQAGIILGRSDLVETLRSHPMARAMRIDAATDAALGATLQSYVESSAGEIPFWRMATLSPEALLPRVTRLQETVGGSIEDGHSLLGAGSAPGARLDSPLLRLEGQEETFLSLLRLESPILVRRNRGDLLVDLRTVDPDDDMAVGESISRCR